MKLVHEEKDKFIIRFDEVKTRSDIKNRAAQNKRTMNAEVLYLIEQGIKSVDRNTNAAQ